MPTLLQGVDLILYGLPFYGIEPDHLGAPILKRGSWLAVEAEVTQSEVSGPTHLGSGKTKYYTKVEFRFAADGKQFTASSSDKSDSLWLAHQTATAFAPGTRHTIRYNPASPNQISFNAGYFKPVYMFRFFLQRALLQNQRDRPTSHTAFTRQSSQFVFL